MAEYLCASDKCDDLSVDVETSFPFPSRVSRVCSSVAVFGSVVRKMSLSGGTTTLACPVLIRLLMSALGLASWASSVSPARGAFPLMNQITNVCKHGLIETSHFPQSHA